MSAIIESVVPLFAVIFLGFFAGQGGLSRRGRDPGARGVRLQLRDPALRVPPDGETELGAITEWGFLGGYFLAQALVFVAGAAIGRLVFRMRMAEMTIQAFGSAFSNDVMLALPLLLWLYGDAGGVPALLIITLDVIVFSVGDGAARARPGRRARRRPAGRRPGRALGPGQPDPDGDRPRHPLRPERPRAARGGRQTLSFIGRAAAPSALFALGASLSLRRIARQPRPGRRHARGKLFLHPALAFLVFAYLLELDPLWLNAGVIFAACPVGINVYVFAQHYQVAIETASSAILISTALAMLTITALLLLLPPVVA